MHSTSYCSPTFLVLVWFSFKYMVIIIEAQAERSRSYIDDQQLLNDINDTASIKTTEASRLYMYILSTKTCDTNTTVAILSRASTARTTTFKTAIQQQLAFSWSNDQTETTIRKHFISSIHWAYIRPLKRLFCQSSQLERGLECQQCGQNRRQLDRWRANFEPTLTTLNKT